eukprot:Skav206181  [mRNA]  locus=scaffold1844:61159:66790:- [translate_table: standard]
MLQMARALVICGAAQPSPATLATLQRGAPGQRRAVFEAPGVGSLAAQARLGQGRVATASGWEGAKEPGVPPGAPAFCYGSLTLREEVLAPVTYRTVVLKQQPLEQAPGMMLGSTWYGQLSLELSSQPLPDIASQAVPPAVHLAHPSDWCGVLRFAADFGELQAANGQLVHGGRLRTGGGGSGGTVQWLHQLEQQGRDVKELFIVERDVVFSAHAASSDGITGRCVKRLSRMRGPGGGLCNMFVEAHPEPVPLEMMGVKQPPRMHLRFFPADFLRPRAGLACLRFTLAAAPPSMELPLVIYVPSGCFSSREQPEASISHIGDTAEVCLVDPSRLVGRSLWRLSANFSGAEGSTDATFLDLLSLKLRCGDERVLTMPVGQHAIVLRLLPSILRLDIPRPVFGVFLPPAEAADELRLHGSAQGEVAGIFVHSLAVHSPHVRRIALSDKRSSEKL